MTLPLPPAGYYALADLEQPLEFSRLFPVSPGAPVELEIGAGKGDFLVEYAKANPGVNFVGIERNLSVLRGAATKIQRAGIENAVLINAEIRYLFENYFGAHSLRAIHVYFPDPWPKKRHAKRRLFQPGTPEMFLRVLKPGGQLHLRTDVESYFNTMLELFSSHEAYSPIEPPPQLLQFQTGFERRFIAQRKPLFRTSFLTLHQQ